METKYLTIQELSEYLPDRPKITTIYCWTSEKKIPFRKFGKKLMFEREKIDRWNEAGRPSDNFC